MSTQIDIPAGWMRDAQGRLVRVGNVQEIDKARDAFVREKVQKAKDLQDRMKAFKKEMADDMQAFLDMSLERYGVKMGGAKGNLTLASFDGSMEICRQVSDYFTFNEGLQGAKILIDQCFREWTKDSPGDLRSIVDRAFRVDRAGNINVHAILSLRTLDISHPKWKEAMRAVTEALQLRASKEYTRFYVLDEHGGKQAVTLDMAAL